MYHAMACLTVPKLSYLGEHSSGARPIFFRGRPIFYRGRTLFFGGRPIFFKAQTHILWKSSWVSAILLNLQGKEEKVNPQPGRRGTDIKCTSPIRLQYIRTSTHSKCMVSIPLLPSDEDQWKSSGVSSNNWRIFFGGQ